MKELNEKVEVRISEEITEEVIKSVEVVIYTKGNVEEGKVLNEICHRNEKYFIYVEVRGIICRIYNDLNGYMSIDEYGEKANEMLIGSISQVKKTKKTRTKRV